MSENRDLERELDAAFASTRPRRGFEDELWAQLEARRSRWRWLRPVGRALFSPAMLGGAAVVIVGLGIFGLAVLGGHRGAGGAATQSSVPASRPATVADARFGLLPRPPATPRASLDARAAPTGGTAAPGSAESGSGAYVPQDPLRLQVYRYSAGAGPAPGTTVEPESIPPGLESATYPTRSPLEAIGQARAGQNGQMVVSGVRIVYVAVADGSTVYLEPVYLVTGTVGTGGGSPPTQVLVPALSPSFVR